jgi:hypothetical protein
VIKHFFGIFVSTEEELITYWNCYKRFKEEEGRGLQKTYQKTN